MLSSVVFYFGCAPICQHFLWLFRRINCSAEYAIQLMISCSVILSFICSYFLFLLFDLVTGEMQRRKAVQQPGSAGRAHRLPQEQPYRLPARRASFRGPGQARDGPRVEEAGYPLRRVQEVNSWRFCIVLV